MRLEELEADRYRLGQAPLVFGHRWANGEYDETGDDNGGWPKLSKTVLDPEVVGLGDDLADAALAEVHEVGRVGYTRLLDGTGFHWRSDSPWRQDAPLVGFILLDGTWRYAPMSSIAFIEPPRAA